MKSLSQVFQACLESSNLLCPRKNHPLAASPSCSHNRKLKKSRKKLNQQNSQAASPLCRHNRSHSQSFSQNLQWSRSKLNRLNLVASPSWHHSQKHIKKSRSRSKHSQQNSRAASPLCRHQPNLNQVDLHSCNPNLKHL